MLKFKVGDLIANDVEDMIGMIVEIIYLDYGTIHYKIKWLSEIGIRYMPEVKRHTQEFIEREYVKI